MLTEELTEPLETFDSFHTRASPLRRASYNIIKHNHCKRIDEKNIYTKTIIQISPSFIYIKINYTLFFYKLHYFGSSTILKYLNYFLMTLLP